MKSVMYHYVRPETESFPHYYHLNLEDFRKQLSYFDKKYGILNRNTVIETIRNDRRPPEGVVLTFDDGLIDHYKWVLPELQRRGLWGIFYVPTAPLQQSMRLDTHKIHAFLGFYGGSKILDELKVVISEDSIKKEYINTFREDTYQNQEESSATLVKRILNYYIKYDKRTAVLEKLGDRLPEADFDVFDFYMSADQLRELHESGMIVGSHSQTHRVLSKLPRPEQQNEIASSFAYLERAVGNLDPKTFCYPYGGEKTFTDDTVALLNKNDCEFSFNVESRNITQKDLKKNPQSLPRYDCNEFPYGTASGSIE